MPSTTGAVRRGPSSRPVLVTSAAHVRRRALAERQRRQQAVALAAAMTDDLVARAIELRRVERRARHRPRPRRGRGDDAARAARVARTRRAARGARRDGGEPRPRAAQPDRGHDDESREPAARDGRPEHEGAARAHHERDAAPDPACSAPTSPPPATSPSPISRGRRLAHGRRALRARELSDARRR